MRKETVYIADDGTSFKDEESCQNYEKRFLSCVMVDATGSIITDPKEASLIYLSGESALKHYIRLCGDRGVPVPSEILDEMGVASFPRFFLWDDPSGDYRAYFPSEMYGIVNGYNSIVTAVDRSIITDEAIDKVDGGYS